MKKKILSKIDLELYTETLKNGLEVYILPKKGNNIYATFTTRYGSKDSTFVPIGEKEMITVPSGIAHFLEHKVFEEPSGDDPFAFFGARGADANASTTTDKTTYLFSGTSSFEENIEYLLDFVQNPYFTEENVEKEKGIIREEILMYEDNPFSKLYEKTMLNAFHENPIRIPIAGTVESIEDITKDLLYKSYNTFYHPSNMFLIITGNVDPGRTLAVIKNNQEKKSFKDSTSITKGKFKEEDTVLVEEDISTMQVTIPKFAVGVKINISKIKKESPYLIRTALSHYMNAKFGITSVFAEELKEEGLIHEDLAIDMIYADHHLLFILAGESEKATDVILRIKKEMEKVSLSKEELERKKKVLMSSYIYMSDNIYAMNHKIMSNLISYHKVIEDDKEMDAFTFEKVNTLLEKLDFSSICTVIIDRENTL